MTPKGMRLIGEPCGEYEEEADLTLVLELGHGFEYKAILPDAIVDEIILKGRRYFLSMQADGTALMCVVPTGNNLPLMGGGNDNLDSIIADYFDSAGYFDDLYRTRNHMRRLRDSLARGLEQADKLLDKPFRDLEDWETQDDDEPYRIK
jgi:hypothetical protein